MGPLVPEIISNELNFVVAIFIGIAFGFILEQAGFSSSKKLVGLFYGYDFTVLRVFFTAGVVAMIGVIAFDHFGLIDIGYVYINPTFLWSAIVGGFIMGLGFVIGGFCPGTSVCAAAIGKIDAMIFIVGSFLGVYIFAEGYPLLETLYKAENWGNIRIFELLGVSQSLFAFLLALMAIAAFWMVTIIETKVNGSLDPQFSNKKLYYALTLVALIISISLFAMPGRKEYILAKAANLTNLNGSKINKMDSDELAFRLIEKDPNIQIIDVRPAKQFAEFSLPKSINLTIDNLFDKDSYKILSVARKKYVFVYNDEKTAQQAAFIANELGYDNIYYLKGGLAEFNKNIINFDSTLVPHSRAEKDVFRFRAEASKVMPVLIKESKSVASVKKATKRVLGGC